MPQEKENLITRINYSERGKGLLGLATTVPFLVLSYDLSKQIGNRIPADIAWGVMLPSCMKTLAGSNLDRTGLAKMGFAVNLFRDIFRFSLFGDKNITLATVPAQVAGTLLWMGFDRSAKALYDSGKTMSLYRLLHIQDRRLEKSSDRSAT